MIRLLITETDVVIQADGISNRFLLSTGAMMSLIDTKQQSGRTTGFGLRQGSRKWEFLLKNNRRRWRKHKGKRASSPLYCINITSSSKCYRMCVSISLSVEASSRLCTPETAWTRQLSILYFISTDNVANMQLKIRPLRDRGHCVTF